MSKHTRAVVAVLLAAACTSETTRPDETATPPAEQPGFPTRALRIDSGPVIRRAVPPLQNAALPPDTMGLQFLVYVPDSSAAINGWSTGLLIETDRGYRAVIALTPPSCLVRLPEPASGPLTFPHAFEWTECERVGVRTSVVLSAERLQALLTAAGDARLTTTWVFQTFPGAYYYVRVAPGVDAAERVRARLQGMPEVTQVDRLTAPPWCVASLDDTPPPCPPWTLTGYRFYSYGAAHGDTIPVSRGGWVRATYTLPDGSRRTREYRFPN